MKRLFVLLALALPSTLLASSAAAAPSTAQLYAACVAQSHVEQARELLRAARADAATQSYRALINDDRCLAQAFGNEPFSASDDAFSTPTLRGNLAERLLLTQPTAVAALQPLPLEQKRYTRPWFAATGRHPAVDEMAVCMAATNPGGIAALIKTDPGSWEEREAFQAITPAMAKCLSAGTQLDVSPPAIRAALADALYQRLTNPMLSTAGMKN
ncbi:MAG: hypothetical protein HOQ20_01905 [Bradyrhizobium sp.]|nr:hypothetical protein [Bradyrhizobium sp.]